MKNIIKITVSKSLLLALTGLLLPSFGGAGGGLFAQNFEWQWAKRGGADNTLEQTENAHQEEVVSIVTDSQNNIYMLSSIGKLNPDVDGNPKQNYGDPTTLTDFVIASFACDGTYRWAKVIGGQGREIIHNLQIDNNDNIYVAGKFTNCGDSTNPYPSRIEDDFILTQSPQDCSLIFLTKFNSEGEMQWIRRPQETTVSLSIGYGQTGTGGLSVDENGNAYWLVAIPQGSYSEGEYINDTEDIQWVVFKYDTDGNFLSALPLNIQLELSSARNLQFYRNKNTGQFYLMSRRNLNHLAIIAGNEVAHSFFLSSFDSQGNFLWLRENTATSSETALRVYNLDFDEDNNIYMGGRISGSSGSFLGFTPGSGTPAYILKLNPQADSILWSQHSNSNTTYSYGAIILNDNEVALTSYGGGQNYSWCDLSININNPGQAANVVFIRLNKETGDCVELLDIPGTPGYYDMGTALATDNLGNYILGGGFGHKIFLGEDFELHSQGPQSDFFIAKYGTSDCPPPTTDECEGIIVSPPTGSKEQSLAPGMSLADLAVEGENLQWYADPALTQPLDPTHTAENGMTYYVTQTIGVCTGEALAVTVEVLHTEDFNGSKLHIYPNPVQNTLFVSSSDILDYELYSITGQLIQKGKISENSSIDVEAVPKGCYMLVLTSENFRQMFKVVKN